MQKYLVKYIRDEKRNPIATVVCEKGGKVGWSLCSKKDRFLKQEGVYLALSRSKPFSEYTKDELPFSMADTLEEILSYMHDRSLRFFK